MDPKARKKFIIPIVSVLGAPVFYVLSQYNYTLFHLTIELFSVIVCIMIFLLAFISQKYASDNLMQRFGYGLFVVAILIVLHTVTFKGVNAIAGYDENISIQFWIALNYIQSISLLTSIIMVNIKTNKWGLSILYFLIGVLCIYLCFARLYPDCYIEGKGLTPFKRVSEYIIMFIYIICLVLLYVKKIEKNLQTYTIAVIMFIVAGFTFTLYSDTYGIENFLGHYIRFVGLTVLFFSVVVTNIQKLYETIFSDLKELSEKDSLTKLYNRNYLDQFLKTIEGQNYSQIFIVMFDVDDYKNINDTYGHDIGDIVLHELSLIMKNNLRISDIPIRYGGDEFLIIFNRTTLEDAKRIWERINTEINNFTFTSKKIKITVSAGFGQYNGNFEKTFKKIDSLILEQKKNGKNQTRYSI